jgi:hypothetical protein
LHGRLATREIQRSVQTSIQPGHPVRPAAGRLSDEARREARALLWGGMGGDAVVVQRILGQRDIHVRIRSVERPLPICGVRRRRPISTRTQGSNSLGGAARSISRRVCRGRSKSRRRESNARARTSSPSRFWCLARVGDRLLVPLTNIAPGAPAPTQRKRSDAVKSQLISCHYIGCTIGRSLDPALFRQSTPPSSRAILS